MKNKMRLFFLCFTFAIGFAPSKAYSQLKMATVLEIAPFNPIVVKTDAFLTLLKPFVFRGMIERSFEGKVLPDLATHIPELKGKTATWTIRKNARWNDGQPVTCADWELGWKASLNENIFGANREDALKIEKIEWNEKNPKECVVTYSSKNWSYDRNLPPLLPFHLENETYDKNKERISSYEQNSNYAKNPTLKGLYNGPYQVSEMKLGSSLTIIKNPFFHGSAPQIDKIVFQHFQDPETLRTQLHANKVNSISYLGVPIDIAITMAVEIDKTKIPYQLIFRDEPIVQTLALNLKKEKLKDIKVREAILRSINTELITTSFFRDKILPAHELLPPNYPAYKKKKNLFSKKVAMQLLDEAGWKIGGTGKREKNGVPLSLRVKTLAKQKTLQNIQGYICGELKAIDVDCKFDNEQNSADLKKSIQSGNYEMVLTELNLPADSQAVEQFLSTEIPSKGKENPTNITRIDEPKIDLLIRKFTAEKSFDERVGLAAQIEEAVLQQWAFLPIFFRRQPILLPSQVSGVRPSHDGETIQNPELWKFN